jgi:hypothetical protein
VGNPQEDYKLPQEVVAVYWVVLHCKLLHRQLWPAQPIPNGSHPDDVDDGGGLEMVYVVLVLYKQQTTPK